VPFALKMIIACITVVEDDDEAFAAICSSSSPKRPLSIADCNATANSVSMSTALVVWLRGVNTNTEEVTCAHRSPSCARTNILLDACGQTVPKSPIGMERIQRNKQTNEPTSHRNSVRTQLRTRLLCAWAVHTYFNQTFNRCW
jgi:hypothetical protein